jgi:hypothetical protein
MAITVDAVGQASGANIDTLNWVHSSVPGVAGYILVGISWQDLSSEGIDITEVIHGEVSLSFICDYWTSAGVLSIWGGVPSSHFSNLDVYWSGGGAYAAGISISFTGVFRANPYSTPTYNSGTGSPISDNIIGLSTDNLLVDFVGMYRSTSPDETPACDSSQTFRASLASSFPFPGGGLAYQRGACSTRPSLDTTVTMQWTTEYTWTWQQVIFELIATPTRAMELTLLGVGRGPIPT